jgi:hypothetical protein
MTTGAPNWQIMMWGSEIHLVPRREFKSHSIGSGQLCICQPVWVDHHPAGYEEVCVHHPNVIEWQGVTIPDELPEDL